MADIDRRNQTSVTEFVLLGFGNLPELNILLFLMFLLIYIVTIVGNIIIIALVLSVQLLHTPMYFFLGNLSCLETCYSSVILPRLLSSFLTGNMTISVTACFVQFYFFGCLATTECFLLAAMSYDRYLAICKPLHYTTLMDNRYCRQLAAGSWISGSLAIATLTVLMTQLTFCRPSEIDHFFCDFTPIVKLSCSDTHLIELTAFVFSSIFTLPPFLLILASYIQIIVAVLRIPSNTRRQKAFSTCSSHLIVVMVYYSTLIVVYMLPDTNTLKPLNKVFSVFYAVLTPLVNPLIYSLRNREVKEALWKTLDKFVSVPRI